MNFFLTSINDRNNDGAATIKIDPMGRRVRENNTPYIKDRYIDGTAEVDEDQPRALRLGNYYIRIYFMAEVGPAELKRRISDLVPYTKRRNSAEHDAPPKTLVVLPPDSDHTLRKTDTRVSPPAQAPLPSAPAAPAEGATVLLLGADRRLDLFPLGGVPSEVEGGGATDPFTPLFLLPDPPEPDLAAPAETYFSFQQSTVASAVAFERSNPFCSA